MTLSVPMLFQRGSAVYSIVYRVFSGPSRTWSSTQFHASFLCKLLWRDWKARMKVIFMRKFFQLGWLFLIVMGLAICACSDENVPGEDENTENNEGGGDEGEGGSDVPTAIKPVMDEESLKFVGGWDGMGPYQASGSSGFGLVDGCWTFYNDGTYTWLGSNSYGFTTELEGKWHYNAEKKMLITDSELGFNWTIEEVSGDMWVGTLLNEKGGTYTYRRKEVPSVACSNIRIIDYKPGGFVLKDTIRNYGCYAGTLKCGVCYSLEDAKKDVSDYQRVYATRIVTDTLLLYGKPFFKGRSIVTQGVFQVELKSLEEDGGYYLCNFIEFEDGNVIYGKKYKAKCVTLSEDAVYLGEEVKDGKIRCWAKGYLHEDGKIDDGFFRAGNDHPVYGLNMDEAVSMLTSLGSEWRLPEVNDMETLVGFVNKYAMVESVSNLDLARISKGYDVTFKSLINSNTLNFTFEEEDGKYSWVDYYTFQSFLISKHKIGNTYRDRGGFGFTYTDGTFEPSKFRSAFDNLGSPYLRPVYEVRVQ